MGEEESQNITEKSGERKVNIREIEALICRLPGVLGCKVVANSWGAVEEIHALISSNRNPKQVVRDVESSLAARWGIDIDHRKISVAQVNDKSSCVAPRPILGNIVIHNEVGRAVMTVEVTLSVATGRVQTAKGQATGPSLRTAACRLSAEATLKALNQFLKPGYIFAVEAADTVTLGHHEAAIVIVTLLTPDGDEENLAGAAVINGDPIESVIRAVLQATNRRFAKVCDTVAREQESIDVADGG